VPYDWKTELPGIFSRHADNCPVRDGLECTCGPLGYRSSIRDWETNSRTISPLFETVHEALAAQRDQIAGQDAARGVALDRGELGALIDEFLQAADDGMGRDGDDRYTREQVRALRGALSYVDSELGTMDVQDVRRRHIQALLGQLRSSGVPPARISAIVDALNDLYAYAIRRELVGFSPVVELDLPDPDPGAPGGTAQATRTAPPPPAPPMPPAWTTGELWTAPPPVGPPWTPFPFVPPGTGEPPPANVYPPGAYTPPPGTVVDPSGNVYPTGAYAPPPGFTYGYPPPPGYTYPGFGPQQPTANGYATGALNTILGQPGTIPDANYDATMQERWLWWTVRIIVIVFVLIALVLVAESV
jgi:hypothetical protein